MRNYIADLLFLAGAAAVTYGAWTVSQPAGFIVGGGFVILTAVAISGSGERAQ